MSTSPHAEGRRPVEERPVRVVSARPDLRHRLRALVDARELLAYLVTADVKIKYKSSVLGLVWSMVAPAMKIGVYFLVFQVILKSGVPDYVVMLSAGMLVWNFFNNVVSQSTAIIVQRSGIVKKVSFPREILALSVVGTEMVYFLLQCVVLAVLMLAIGHAPDWSAMWLLPFSFASLLFFTAAIGVFLSAANVYLRDTQHLVEVGLQMWFWLTPVVYSFEQTVSPMLHRHGVTWLYFLNPTTPIVMTFQRVLYANVHVLSTTPTHQPLTVLPTWPLSQYFALNAVLLATGVAAFFIAIRLFGRLEGNFAEEL